MPRISVWFVRAALIYLLLGFGFGGLILAVKGIAFAPVVWILLPIHIEFLVVGWLIQLAMGVAFWILPRFSLGPPRGDERLVWAAFVLLNAGILAIALELRFPTAAVLGRLLEGLAVLLFVAANWRRVRAFGRN